MKVIFNAGHIAFSTNFLKHTQLAANGDVEKNFFTPYGMVMPITATGAEVVRSLRGEIPFSKLAKSNLNCYILHVNHLGHVWFVDINSDADFLIWTQITGTDWSVYGFRGDPLNNTIAYGHLLQGCKTIDKAILRLEHVAMDGFYKPHVHSVSDIAKRLTELGYTKPWYSSKFIDLED